MRRLLTTLLLVASLTTAPSASADECAAGGSAVDNGLLVGTECTDDPSAAPAVPASDDNTTSDYLSYQWASVCRRFEPSASQGTNPDCAAARNCPDPAERVWTLWGRLPGEQGWDAIGTQCFGRPPGPGETPRPPEIGPGDVLTALRRIGLPALEAKTQPADKTLVNFETIFYAEPQTFARTLTLLGQRVEVEATPTTYTWHHGDGTSTQTSTPGARYPAKEVVHEYTDAQVTVSPSVDVTYSARFRVNGGAWQEIPETVTISGPQGSLRIAEATAVLSGQYD